MLVVVVVSVWIVVHEKAHGGLGRGETTTEKYHADSESGGLHFSLRAFP